jgi:cell division protein FtsW
MFDAERAQNQKTANLFCLCVILLMGTGLITLYSASYSFATRFFGEGNYLIKKQLIYGAVGIACFIVFSLINFNLLRKFILPIVIIAAFLCILTFVPRIGVERNNATRWIKFGVFTYQPSEMVKFALPLYLAHLLDKKSDNLDNFYSGIFPPVLVTGIFFGLIYGQNNFSTAVFIVINALIIFFLAGIRYRYFFVAITMIIPVSALLVFTKEYRVKRLISFLRPQWEPLGAALQVNASKAAIVSSGFWGKGIGEGTRKLAGIPEIHSDFVFSAYVEETGFIGILLFFALFAVFAVLGYKAALDSKTLFGKLLAGGLTTLIASQALLNTAVVSGAVPATGIPLPFFSAGGSSLITTMICSGLITNVARNKSGVASGKEKSNYGVSEDDNEY